MFKDSPIEEFMTRKSNKANQAAFKARQRELGKKQVAVWIPKEKLPELVEFVKSLQ